MSIDVHRLMERINNNRLIFIDYIDYIDCFPMIDFHRLDRPGKVENPIMITCTGQDVCKFLYRLVTVCHILSTGKHQKQLRDGKSPHGHLK